MIFKYIIAHIQMHGLVIVSKKKNNFYFILLSTFILIRVSADSFKLLLQRHGSMLELSKLKRNDITKLIVSISIIITIYVNIYVHFIRSLIDVSESVELLLFY